ncbi:MAG: hypothetical protein ACK5XH_09135 [Lysobacteraceae bacterium]
MLDGLRPATLLAAAFAAWSAGLLVAAFAGLGGRVGPHPDDLALAPPLPTVHRAVGDTRLGSPSQYLAVGERPLLNADRRPAPVAVAATEAEAPFEGVLTSVLLTGTLKMAIFGEQDGQVQRRVRLGDTIPGTSWRLAGLEPRRAVLDGPGGQRVLDLRVFDGKGGVAPTPVQFPTDAAAPKPAQGLSGGTVTGGTPAPGVPALPVPASSNPPSLVEQATAANAEAARRAAEEQAQVEAIRARIEARRAQLREQAANANAPSAER